jgi:hypothetical protein
MQAALTGMLLGACHCKQKPHKSTKAWDVRNAVQALCVFLVVTGGFS